MKRTLTLKTLWAVLLGATLITGCSKDEIPNEQALNDQIIVADYVAIKESGETTLYAGQSINVGTVNVSVADDNLNVTYNIKADGWELVETHLWAGNIKEAYPQAKNGNPKIGNFPYNSGNITGSKTYTVTIPLVDLGVTNTTNCEEFTLYFASHASMRKLDASGNVIQTETAWGAGYSLVERGSWATGFSILFYCKEDAPVSQVNLGHETAFAYGGATGDCFLNIDEDNDGTGDFNRWGWYVGPISEGTYSYEIYAGAGQCDLSKGTKVGTLTVDYSAGTATVTYKMDSGYTMGETQLYVGSEILPRDKRGEYTVAPGQYPSIHGVLDYYTTVTDTYTVTGLSGQIYVVAHANVYGF